MVAVNERYARGDLALCAGDTVAIIPPVAGG
jgi:molybdopterin converting factor small subunit